MRLSGRPIRRMLIPSTVLLTAVVMGWSAPAFCAGWNQPLREKKHDAKRQVEALEEQWRQAQLVGDVAAMDKLLSDDYIGLRLKERTATRGSINVCRREHGRLRASRPRGCRGRKIRLIREIPIATHHHLKRRRVHRRQPDHLKKSPSNSSILTG
jgi:hypothetical protein